MSEEKKNKDVFKLTGKDRKKLTQYIYHLFNPKEKRTGIGKGLTREDVAKKVFEYTQKRNIGNIPKNIENNGIKWWYFLNHVISPRLSYIKRPEHTSQNGKIYPNEYYCAGLVACPIGGKWIHFYPGNEGELNRVGKTINSILDSRKTATEHRLMDAEYYIAQLEGEKIPMIAGGEE